MLCHVQHQTLIQSTVWTCAFRRRELVNESAAPMKASAGSVRERAAHLKESATPSKLVARVARVSPRPKEKAFCVCGWSEDAWDNARAYILVGSVETTDERFEVEVPSTAVMDMSGVSAGTSVCIVVDVPADNSPPTLRAEALSPSNGPTTSVSLASLNLTFDEVVQFEGLAHWAEAVIRKGLQIGHNDCPNAGSDKLRAHMKGNLGFIFGDQMFIARYSRGVGKQQALAWSKSQTNLQCRFGVAFRTDRYGSIADQFLQLLSIGMKMVGPGASEIVLDLATVALVDGASVFIFSAILGVSLE